jgi:hypothetical protein
VRIARLSGKVLIDKDVWLLNGTCGISWLESCWSL